MKIINGQLPELKGISYATLKNGFLSSAVIPIDFEGKIESGSIEKQAALTFANMKHIVEEAGGSLTDIAQVIVYLKDLADKDGMNAVWNEYFSEFFPNRATFIISDFAVEGMKIELVFTAIISE